MTLYGICFDMCHHITQFNTCGHFVCSECLEKYKSSICPMCQVESTSACHIPYLEQKINEMRYVCSISACCGWKGTVCEFRIQHQYECPYSILTCVYDCGQRLFRRDMRTHLEEDCMNRPGFCSECYRTYTQETKKDHDLLCTYRYVVCHTCKRWLFQCIEDDCYNQHGYQYDVLFD